MATLMIGVAGGVAGRSVWRSALIETFESDYAALVAECDSAMREHLIAKLAVQDEPSEESVAGLRAAELGLLACQDYDIFQKRLVLWGLSENELSLMRLHAVERTPDGLGAVVREHELRY